MYATDRRDVALRISSLVKDSTCMTNSSYELVDETYFTGQNWGTERVVDACTHIKGFARVTELYVSRLPIAVHVWQVHGTRAYARGLI